MEPRSTTSQLNDYLDQPDSAKESGSYDLADLTQGPPTAANPAISCLCLFLLVSLTDQVHTWGVQKAWKYHQRMRCTLIGSTTLSDDAVLLEIAAADNSWARVCF